MRTLFIALAIFCVPLTAFGADFSLLAALQTQFEGSELAHMYQIALCESSGYQNARHLNENGTTDYGILQINSIHEKEAAKLGLNFKNSIEDNVRMARLIFEHQGYSAWLVCSTRLEIEKGQAPRLALSPS